MISPGQQIGPFTVEKEIGSGAMGSVYLARYKNNQRVALKFISSSLTSNETSMARFEREAEILKQLKHPNIVRLFGYGKHKRIPYYAMEYVEGESLDRVLARRGGKLPWEEVVRLGQQLCDALQHAHEQGIVHRDLKPSNLMILKDGTLKLTDFGIAKDLDVTALTEAHCTVGTASYMSPEQCKGDKISHKSDLYTLGIVFYELLTGSKPFEAENVMDMFLMHVKGKFERPSRKLLDIPVWLDNLVCQLLEKKPDKRPFDAAVVRLALENVAEKVATQKSAGVEAVTAPSMASLSRAEKTDRAAARTLATSLGKGGKKKKAKPFFKQVWFQAISLVAAIIVVVVATILIAQPPSAKTLYENAERLMRTNNPDKIEKARDEPIARYLELYGTQNDDMTRQIRAWATDVDRQRGEKRLNLRVSKGLTPDSDAEKAAHRALEHEGAGELELARDRWQDAEKFKDDSNVIIRGYGLVAEKHLAELTEAAATLTRIDNKVALQRKGQDEKFEAGSEEAAALALRYEKFGDLWEAHSRWQALKAKTKDSDAHLWYLIASGKTREVKAKLPGKETDERTKLLDSTLKEGEEAAAGSNLVQREAALRSCLEIRTLYGTQAPLKERVNRAEAIIKQLGG
jgi:serine/threonine-protein kinase